MMIAPMLGPTMRARLKPLEFSAIAPGRSSRPTSSITNDCRAGISKAPMKPLTSAKTSSHVTVMCPDQVNHQRSAAWIPRHVCAMRTMRSLSERSTNHPACIEMSRIGNDAADATSPTMNALFDSSSANQPSDIACIQVPISDSVCPNQKSRKFRCRRRVWNGLSDPGAWEGTYST